MEFKGKLDKFPNGKDIRSRLFNTHTSPEIVAQLVSKNNEGDIVSNVCSKVHHTNDTRVEAGPLSVHGVPLITYTSRPV